MVSFDKPILLGVMRITEHDRNSKRMTKAHQSGREVTALGRSHPADVAVQSDGGG